MKQQTIVADRLKLLRRTLCGSQEYEDMLRPYWFIVWADAMKWVKEVIALDEDEGAAMLEAVLEVVLEEIHQELQQEIIRTVDKMTDLVDQRFARPSTKSERKSPSRKSKKSRRET